MKNGRILKALIAVRSGSQRVKNKNIRPFAGSSLLELKIKQLKKISYFDGIIVNSNDEKMLEIAKKNGVDIVKRDEKYASNTVSMSDVYKNMAENMECDDIAYINVTNPLLKDETIIKAVEEFYSTDKEFDSLNSAHLIKEFLFKDGLPLNYDLRHQPRSQDLPDIAALNFAVSIISKKNMIECKNIVGYKPDIFLINEIEATDIDNQIDFDFAEFVYKRGF